MFVPVTPWSHPDEQRSRRQLWDLGLYSNSKWHGAGMQAPCPDVSMSELCDGRDFSKVCLR